MIGILVITHRDMGNALIDTAVHIIGNQKYVASIATFPQDGLETIRAKIKEVITTWEQEDVREILILVDMFGGTPCNAAVPFLSNPSIEIISGLNLSMFITAVTQRMNADMKTLVLKVTEAAQHNIMSIRSLQKK